MTPDQINLSAELAALGSAATYLEQHGRPDHAAAVRAAMDRYVREFAERLSPIEPYSD